MKKVLVFVAPILIAALIFFGILAFLNRKTGKGALQVTSIPQSKVYLENKLIGVTPLCACDLQQMLPVGDYSIKLIPIDGKFRPFEEKISINKTTLTVVDRTFADGGSSEGNIISLVPAGDKKDTELLVVSIPDKANVFLDSNPVGVTPLLLKQISESDHNLKLTLDGYMNKSLKIKTAQGFRLSALVFLGISNNDLVNSSSVSASITPSPTIVATRVLILDTPTGFLRVRESSSVVSSEIAQVKPKESYELIVEKAGWFQIKLTDGKVGWISSSYAVKK